VCTVPEATDTAVLNLISQVRSLQAQPHTATVLRIVSRGYDTMAIDYKTILFTSNLSTASRVAFNHALALANRFGAKLILLHVMESSPSNYESYMIGLFGQDKWHQVLRDNREEAKHALVGKVTPKQMARTALSQFCREDQPGEDGVAIPQNTIIVKEGNVVEWILTQAEENNCDLIVMGAGEGLLSNSSIGKNIKSVMKKSKIPVLVVPATLGE
jgi:nucleotide-binding universal stress UspA family protein